MSTTDQGEQLHARHHELELKIGELRATIYSLTQARTRARSKLAEQIGRLMSSQYSNAPTPNELVHQHAKEQAALRRAAKGQKERAPEPVANSVIDRQQQRYGDADTFVQKQIRNGHRRAGLPSALKGMRAGRRA
jgi:hypothetical protein